MTQKFPFSADAQFAMRHEPPGQWITPLPAGCIRLNSGYPEPSFVPSEELKTAVVRLLEEEKDLPLQYIGSPRILGLQSFIQQRLAKRDVIIQEEELLVTSGSCQAIDLAAQTLLDEEAVVALEAPTYMEALEIFRNYTDQFINVPVDERGLQTDLLATMLAERKEAGLPLPRLLYTIPTFQNPTGTTLPLERRRHLLDLAAEYDFIILEDDAYGDLGFTNQPRLLKAMDPDNRVIYLGSFSKTVAPGMRIGWAAGPEELINAMNYFKKDLNHPFAQATMASFFEMNDFDDRLNRITALYHSKCRIMLQALEEFMPPAVSWFVPEGGYFVWVTVPGVNTTELLTKALTEGVAYVPGEHFFENGQDGLNRLRLSFSYANEEEIVKGVQLLAAVIGPNLP